MFTVVGHMYSRAPGCQTLLVTFKIYIFKHPLRAPQEFPPETRHVLQVETWVFVVVSTYVKPDQTPRMLSPAKLSKSSGGAPGSGAPGYGRTWVHLIAFSRCGLKFFFRFFASHTQLAQSTKKAHPLSQLNGAAQRRAVPCGVVLCRVVPCGAVPCCAVLCRAVPCCTALCRAVPYFAAISLPHIPDDNASKHRVRESQHVLQHFIQQWPSFSIWGGGYFMLYRLTATAVKQQ